MKKMTRLDLSGSKVLASVLLAMSAAFAVSCGDDAKEETTTPAPAALAYADISSVVARDCAKSGCHAAGSAYGDLSTETALKATKSGVLARIALAPSSAGAMPSGSTLSTAWDKSTDGARVKAYLDSVQ